MQVDDAVGEAALVDQLELEADPVGEGAAPPADDDRGQEQVALVHQRGGVRALEASFSVVE